MPVTNLPNPLFVASVPLQYVFIDKDTGGPLSAGIVKFFSDPLFTTPKNVYEITNNPDNTITFTSLGNILTLSGIGTFIDGSGENLTPYYYPWTNDPSNSDPGDKQLYFVEVYNSNGVFQFTLTNWPPNSLTGGSDVNFQEALSNNLITNPGFSVVNFTVPPGSSTYSYNVTGSNTFPVAPGWNLVAAGTGTIQVAQKSLNVAIPSQGPYALQIIWSTGFTDLSLVQTLTNSPRIIAGSPASASVVVNDPNNQIINVQLHYISSMGGIDVTIANGNTSGHNQYTTISGTEPIPIGNNDNANGYVNFSIEFGSLTSGATININSVQLVEVGNDSIIADYIQQTTQDELNGLMWYYEPQLAYKPIPSYTLGWNFQQNPCQLLGTTVGLSGLGNNTARYIADQTIVFESVGNTLHYGFFASAGLNPLTATSDTQFALIQYLPQDLAFELLQGRMAVQLQGSASTPINGNISLWYTTNVALPSVPIGTNHATFFSSLTAGVPTTIAANWIQIDRGGLGQANFTLNGTQINLNGWFDITGGAGSAKYFAIVIGFDTYTTTNNLQINYCTLCRGDIATPPPAMNDAQILQGLQYYCQKSYQLADLPGTATYLGAISTPFPALPDGGGLSSYIQNFSTPYVLKRAIPNVTYYSAFSGVIDKITVSLYNNGALVGATPPDASAGSFLTPSPGTTGNYMQSNSNGTAQHTGSAPTAPYFAVGVYHFVADARLGQV